MMQRILTRFVYRQGNDVFSCILGKAMVYTCGVFHSIPKFASDGVSYSASAADGSLELVHPTPSTLNPQPSTLNPQPSTLNPQPSTFRITQPFRVYGVPQAQGNKMSMICDKLMLKKGEK